LFQRDDDKEETVIQKEDTTKEVLNALSGVKL